MSNNIRYVSTADLNLPLSELYRCMGYGNMTPEAELCQICEELLKEACRVARPQFHYSILDCEEIKQDGVTLTNNLTNGSGDGSRESIQFECGKTISGLLRRSSQVAVFVATAGEEFQQWSDEIASCGDMINTFIIDSIGSMMVESVGDYMETVLEKELAADSLKHTNRFSPGYCGWDIREQRKLFGVLPNGVCSIDLNESCLMHPIKSISGFIGVGEEVLTKKYGCSICKKLDCYLRRV